MKKDLLYVCQKNFASVHIGFPNLSYLGYEDQAQKCKPKDDDPTGEDHLSHIEQVAYSEHGNSSCDDNNTGYVDQSSNVFGVI